MTSINKHLFNVICLLGREITIESVINFEDSDIFRIAPWNEHMFLYKFMKLILVSRLGLLALNCLGT